MEGGGQRGTSFFCLSAGTKDFLNSYTYDALAQMTDLSQQGQTGGNAVAVKSFYWGHNALGDVTQIDRANYVGMGPYPTPDAADTALTYNSLDQLTGMSHAYNGTVLDNLTWTFDPLGRLATFGSSDGTATYGYDKNSQVVSATYTTNAGGHQPANESNTFDPNGNRTAANGTSATVSSGNHVTNDGTFTYSFDAEGNRTSRQRISTSPANDYLVTYAWDYRNRLTDVEFYNNSHVLTQHIHYVYDVFDRLIERDVDPTGGGTYTQIVHNVWDFTSPPLPPGEGRGEGGDGGVVLEFNGQQQLTTRLLNGPNVNVNDQYFSDLAQEAVSSPSVAGSVTYNLLDDQGTLRDIVDANGVSQDHLVYAAFGQLAYESNPSAPHLTGYAGGIVDAATGLSNFRERWYDPTSGAWMSRDPLGFVAGDTNLSRYVSNGPASAVDPSGLSKLPRVSKEARHAVQQFLDEGVPLPDGFLDNPLHREYLEKFQDSMIDLILKTKGSLKTCTNPKMIGTHNRTIERQTKRLLNLGKLGEFSKRIPGVRYGAVVILFAADAKANGVGGATANATPIVGDIRGIREDLSSFYTDLSSDVAKASDLLQSHVAHGRERASEAFARFVPYELGARSCESFDQSKLRDALDAFYHDLYYAYQSEVKTSLEIRAFGFAFPVTVDRSRVGTANINPAVERFQQALDDAVIQRQTNGQ